MNPPNINILTLGNYGRTSYIQARQSNGSNPGIVALNPDGNGWVSINTINTTTKPGLYIHGDITYTGNLKKAADGQLKDVHAEYKRGVNELKALNPVVFSYKENNALQINSEEKHIGLIAQEVQQTIPEAVMEGKDGYLMLKTNPILFAMLNAIKEQQKVIEEQGILLRELQLQNATLAEGFRALK